MTLPPFNIELYVTDGLPTCSANANLTDLLEGETFTVSCEMTYSAAWDPTMKWTDNRNNEITANEGGEDGSRRKTTITIQAQNGDTKSFRCLMQFGFPPAGVIPPNEGGNTFSRHDPGYRETYQTDVMNVWGKYIRLVMAAWTCGKLNLKRTADHSNLSNNNK